MKTFFRERRRSSIFTAIVSIAAGAVLIAFPQDAVRWICMALGALLVVVGAAELFSYFRGGKLRSAFQFDLVVGVVLAVVGLWLLLRPNTVIALLQYVFGAFILIHGVLQLQAAVALRGGILPILMAAIPIVLGIVVLLDPFSSLAALVVLIGIILVYNGLIDLYLILRLSRAAARAEAAFEEAAAEEEVLGNAQFTESANDSSEL